MRQASRWIVMSIPPWLWVAAVIALVPALVAAATYRDLLGLVALGAVAVAGVFGTLGKPLPIVLLYVGLIPLESVLVLGEAGTITRLVGIVFFMGYALRRFGHIDPRTIPLPGWLFVGWAGASLLWALDASVAITQLTTLVQLFLITLVMADLVAREPNVVRPVLLVYSASAVASAAIGIGAFAMGSSFLVFGRAGAFESQDPAQFSAVLVPALFVLIFELRGRRHIGWVLAGLVVLSTAILLSGTRSAWLAVLVGFLFGVVPRLGNRALVPAILAGLSVLAVVQIPEIGAYVAGRAGSAVETGGAGRIDIWSVGLAIFSNRPILGVGLGNFPVAFTPEIIRDVRVPGLNPGILIPGLGPHSSVIGTLTELGTVGAGAFATFLGMALVRRGSGASSVAVQVALLALLTQSLLLDIFNRKQVWLIIAIALGLAWNAVLDRRQARADADAARADADAARQHRVDRMRRTWGLQP